MKPYPTDCRFDLNADGLWQCTQCPYIYPIKSAKPPRRNCPQSPSLVEAAKKLGIPENEIGRYASMLRQWRAENCPVRDEDEVNWIYHTLCKPCESHVNGCQLGRCASGACKRRSRSVELTYMLRMATSCCPLYKF